MPYFSSVRSATEQKFASGSNQQITAEEHRIISKDISSLNNEDNPLEEKRSPETTGPPPSQRPVDATSLSENTLATRAKQKKSLRFEQGLRVHWARFMRRVGQENETTDSALGESTEQGDAEVFGAWERRADAEEDEADDEKSVDEVVVDRSWGRSGTISESVSDEEDGLKSSGVARTSKSADNSGTSTNGDLDGRNHPSHGFWSFCLLLTIIRWRLWPAAVGFFSPRFPNQKSEEHYKKEIWFQSKPLALWSALFFVINWVLGCALLPRPFSIADNIYFFGVAPVLTLPIPFLVMFDFARDRPYVYNTFVVISTWSWSVYQVIYIYICGYYSGQQKYGLSCGNKDFLSLFYYTSGLQTIALFGLKLNRFPAMLGAIVFLVMSASMVIPFRIGWIRNDLNFLIFQAFLLYIHYMKEVGERRLFLLRDQLKMQFKATQKAQMNERKASESKRRLTSYVFHDKFILVRVPLNTALIAVQNMEASDMIQKDQEVEFSALSGSLSMMSKVLNDVLDFNRMDSGLLESVSMPYAFHAVMRSMFIPLQLATNARRLKFVTELDNAIDVIARRAVWDSLVAQNKLVVREGIDTFEKESEAYPDEDGVVVGDEMRLRQIVTNLVSNACKFTPAGGTLTVRTRLISPYSSNGTSERQGTRSNTDTSMTAISHARSADIDLEKGEYTGLSAKTLDQHNASHRKRSALDRIIVRIEVSDTGYGIKAKDIAKGKLFSAFNQTEQGRLQGGKGTGLGLALVRHIVSLSGGRLGLQSKVGVGSTFWVELPLGVGKKAAGGTISSGPNSDRAGPTVIASARPKANPTQTTMKSESGSTAVSQAPERSLGNSDTIVGSSNSVGRVSQSSSALKSLMDQGGLVELGTTDSGRIPTRSIGDPSTGTDAGSLVGDLPSPQDQSEVAQRTEEHKGISPAPTGRPSHVDLPERPLFGQTAGVPRSANPASENKSATSLDPPLRILVVDDDQLTRKLMKRMLQRLGCVVSTAENGQIAFDLITGDGSTPASDAGEIPGHAVAASTSTPLRRDFDGPRYELIFLDNQMPVLSGLDLVKKLRDLGRRDFVVGVTGNALISDQEEYQEAGVDYVITKPVFEISLKGMIALAAERRKNVPFLEFFVLALVFALVLLCFGVSLLRTGSRVPVARGRARLLHCTKLVGWPQLLTLSPSTFIMSQQDLQDVQHAPGNDDIESCDAPPTPPSPDDLDTDTKGSRKREREVSLEPATPKADEPASEDTTERRTPAPKKKNRMALDPTKEEDETPPESPTKVSVDLSTSPPYESKVRQISRKVRGMKWDDKERPAPEFSQDTQETIEEPEASNENGDLQPPVEISQDERIVPDDNERAASTEQHAPLADDEPRTPVDIIPDSSKEAGPPPSTTQTVDSDSDEQEKGLKRKMGERQTSTSPEEQTVKAIAEASKRSRDDNEEDVNPRERKRPTPPPEEREERTSDRGSQNGSPPALATEPVAPQPKVGGFLAYAATSSPFAHAKGPSVFGQKSTPSPSPLAGTSNGSASSLSSAFGIKPSSPFAIPSGNKLGSASKSVFGSPSALSSSNTHSPNNLSTSPAGTKRSGFEAFAAASSPFAAAARSKSPTGAISLARSKSPTRRSAASSINAFKSYAGSGTQSFSAPSPPVKKQRHDSGDDADDDKASTSNVLNATSNGASSEESEEEADKPTFADRLRAEHNTVESHDGSEEDEKPIATEQEVHTGEEQEDTVFQVRGKLYALSEQNAWKERGTGLLKLNVRKSDGGGARLVMRKEAVFTLLLNVPLFKGMRCNLAQDPRYVRFSCIETEKTVHYNIRLSNAKVAGELLEEINANIPSDEPDDSV
ncbi:hypothetical protein ACEPAF_796 [Sanghuangporus sanghuang]